MQRVHFVGLDFGSTTSSAVVASAVLRRSAVTGRTDLSDVQELFRSEMTFTPYLGDRLDLDQIDRLLESWLRCGNLEQTVLFGGGALLTGLAAEASNSGELVRLIRSRLGDALIASADDPYLESWLAFMGSCAGLSLAHPEQPFLNLDIGGGTTNLALGLAGEVLATDWRFIGARHVQVELGSYRMVNVTSQGQVLLDELGIGKPIGAELTASDVSLIIEQYLDRLEKLVRGMIAAAPRKPGVSVALSLSGGVGELVYRHLHGEPWPGTTAFGDLGIDLARGLVEGQFWREHWRRFEPAAGGRATVYGLLRHNTQVSGNTVYLRHPEDLPLGDVPILGTITATASMAEIADRFRLAEQSLRGAAYQIVVADESAAAVRCLAERLSAALRIAEFPVRQPLVLLMAENVGKALGQYVTGWGTLPWRVLVIDEISCQNAQYAHIGAMHDQVIPVSFFRLNP